VADRWQRVESLCHAALARPAGERAAFLVEACSGDPTLRAEVESLIGRAESSASFLETPAIGVATVSLIGRRLGAYRIEQPIGAGGMGEVYRAKDTRLGRDVAVKILPAALAADPQRRSRFEREARAVAALNHPNICTIHDVGQDQGLDFLVMELVDGEPLASRLKKGPLPLDEALARAIEIADALDRAHGQGIVHRDLKPGNVMLARTGAGTATHAKLLDFGLARMAPSAADRRLTATAGDTAPVTEAGAVLGTLQYMAPEQIEGRPADARTDIFAFGIMLYEMTTGRRAFDGGTGAALMAAILREDPVPVYPHDLGRIVKRCLEKDPLRRYQSARDLVNDLDEIKHNLGSAAAAAGAVRPVRAPGWRLALWAVPLLAAAVFAIGGYGWSGSSDYSGARIERYHLQPPRGTEIQPAGPNSVLAISPDGRWVAFRTVSAAPNRGGLYLRGIGDLEAKQIAAAGASPFFSPDSRWLGFVAENAMHKVPVAGGRPERICQVPNILSIRGASWGSDDVIVFSLDRALWRVSAAGGTPAQLTQPGPNARHYWPQVLPGGAAAVFTANEGYNDRWRKIALASLKTGESRMLPDLSGTVARYSPTGHLLFSRFGALHAAPFDVVRLEVTGKPVKVLDDVHTFLGSGSALFDLSASGSLVFSPGADLFPDGELQWVDRDGTMSTFDGRHRPYLGASVDPSGTRVAAAIADEFGEADLWVCDIARCAWSRLTSGMHAWSEIVWSPDSRSIFFTSFKSGEAEVFRIPSSGGEPEQLTFDSTVWEHPGSVSADGKTLVFWQASVSRGDLMTVTLDPQGKPQNLTRSPPFSRSSPRLSPDGRLLAYVSNETGSTQIHVRAFPGPGETLTVSADGGANPWWSADGRELFYQRGSQIWSVTADHAGSFRQRPARMIVNAGFTDGSTSVFVPATLNGRFLAIRRAKPERRLVYVPNWAAEMKQILGLSAPR
jgi:serine/threonine-protein kinase